MKTHQTQSLQFVPTIYRLFNHHEIIIIITLLITLTINVTSTENEEDNLTLPSSTASFPTLSSSLQTTRYSKKVHFIHKIISLSSSSSSPTAENASSQHHDLKRTHHERHSAIKNEIQRAAMKGLQAMVDLYEKRELEIFDSGATLEANSPGAKLSMFSAPTNYSESNVKAAYAALETAKILKKT